jgi:hypothetical protein
MKKSPSGIFLSRIAFLIGIEFVLFHPEFVLCLEMVSLLLSLVIDS